MVVVSRLFYYPLKSAQRVEVSEAEFTELGIVGDREYMVVDESGELISQREAAAVALVRADDVIAACEATGHRMPVKVHSWQGEGEDQGDTVAMLLSQQLGTPARVVRFPTDYVRRTTVGDAATRYADGYPMLVTTERSLTELNSWLEEPVPMERFRPNIVLEGVDDAFAEDDFTALTIAGVRFDLVKACGRCVVITIDQDTGAKGRQPLRTLGQHRVLPQLGGGQEIMFGVNAAPRGSATIRVGDEVQIERADRPYAERVAAGSLHEASSHE